MKRPLVSICVVLAAACGSHEKLTTSDAGLPLPGDACLDNDGDGYPGTGKCNHVDIPDCEDNDPDAHPGAAEVCNGRDDNCDDQVDEGLPKTTYYVDADGDGVGGPLMAGKGCAAPPPGQVTQSGDCNDTDPAIRPGVAETCNDVDDDCDGTKDNGLPFQDFYIDSDGDGFGDASGAPLSTCLTSVMGRVPNKSDCNDHDPTVKPGATEICNRRDDNCDGQVDNGIVFESYYPDVDGDGYGAVGSTAEMSCGPVAGKVTNANDCDDSKPTIKPMAPETCDGADDNCNGMVDEGLAFADYYPDADGDGVGANVAAVHACAPIPGKVTVSGDCNDANAAVKPGATELCNGVDDNCNGTADEGLTFASWYADGDGDGYGAGAATQSCAPVPGRVTVAGDCNDGNAAVHPGAAEVCNGVDDDCAGGADNGLTFVRYYPDSDGDTFGNKLAPPQSSCAPVPGKVTNNLDCDDALFAVHPGAAESCNGRDDNCDGQVDEGQTFSNYYPDLDSDGFGSASAVPQAACAAVPGKVTDHTDCDDTRATVHPFAAETCNSLDDNCDGQVDNGTMTLAYYVDSDGDGYGTGTNAVMSCSPVAGRAPNNADCDDTRAAVHPNAPEVCNGLDDNCVNGVDEGLTFLSYWPDVDSDGFGSASASAQSSCSPLAGEVTNNLDCNDSSAAVKPGAAETCNQVDDNCNGVADEGLPTQPTYADSDGDGFGAGAAVQSCGLFGGRVSNNTDCNDANPAVRPNAAEVCNGIDDNCVNGVDENDPGGGAACATGQLGACSAGTRHCVSGAVSCVRSVAPTSEVCNGADDDCNGASDEPFTDKGAACTAGQGVCQRSGTMVCRPDGLGTQCSAVAGAPTPPACDGLDNDCDGIADEPYLSSTYNLQTPVAWADLEVAPLYLTAGSCAGGVNGAGTDALFGGALVMGGGSDGFYFQALDATGGPMGAPTTIASSFRYVDVAVAQAADGFLAAGLYDTGSDGTGNELDLYYLDATGTQRAYAWSLFNSGHTLDSLRVVRGYGKRVMIIWRDDTVGLRWYRVEPTYSGGVWSITPVGGGTLDYTTTSNSLVASAAVLPGVGADSSLADWGPTQTCVAASTQAQVGVAYRVSATVMKHFTVSENGTGKSADIDLRTVTSPRSVDQPDVAFYSSGGNQYFVSYVMHDPGNSQTDLEVWLSGAPMYDWAYLQYATANGASSIARPRGSATASRLYVTALRWVADASGFNEQVMTRTFDFAGGRDPATYAVEVPPTAGSCGADPACRPGNKDGLTQWAAFGRVYYSGSGASPTGAFASQLTCQ